MSTHHDRYKTIGQRDFGTAVEHLLETEFKLVGSHRVIRMIVEAIMDVHREFYPETSDLAPGTILWATTKRGEGTRVSWGKRAEEYGIQLVRLPLVTRDEIDSRMTSTGEPGSQHNRRKEAQRDIATMVRLVKSAAAQDGLLTGAELSVLMNRSLGKIHEYIRTWEAETGEALPLKGYVLDMGSSPTHKGIICRKSEEGMSPPDIARATGHTLAAVDNYLGTYERIKVLLRRGFDVDTLGHVTGKAARTIAQYMAIVECYHPDLVQDSHRQWLAQRRKKAKLVAAPETLAPMTQSLANPGTPGTGASEKTTHSGSQELVSKRQAPQRPRSRSSKCGEAP
jgi:hypothetical protein